MQQNSHNPVRNMHGNYWITRKIKKCEFCVVPGNGQALLGMLDTAALKVINVNIDSIEAASMKKENCNTNIEDTKKSDTRQADHVAK